jgi:small-conductance mechanosensitive channel
MVGVEALPSFVRRGLWFVAAGAVLTGFWLAPSTLLLAIAKGSAQYWGYAALGLLLLAAGIAGWAWLVSVERRREVARVTQAAVVTLAALAAAWMIAGIIGINYRACRPGETNGPLAITWLASAIVYYVLGYFGFARFRRLQLIWPLAVVVAVFVLLAVELIWTTGSGCGD